MNEPRVESLSYGVSSASHTQYKNPKAQDFRNLLGRFLLADGQLTFWPDEHFSSVDEAQAAVNSFLRAWEIQAGLQGGEGTIRFQYSSGHVVDVHPVGPGSVVINAVVSSVAFADAVLTVLTKGAYPNPPTEFRVTTEVELAIRRWWNYQAGSEPLLGAAYVVYTILVPRGRRNKEAATLFAIEEAVLRKLSELSSTRGDASTIRKVEDIARMIPLSDPDRAWIEAAVPMIIRRLGDHAGGAPLTPIRMVDLPPL